MDGRQYVSVLAGWGGAFALVGGDAAAAAGANPSGRLLTFALGGDEALTAQPGPAREPTPLPVDASAAAVARGNALYHEWCATCHGIGAVGGGVLPDLRYAAPSTYEHLDEIVLEGAYEPKGMPGFGDWLDADDLDALRAYLLSRAAALRAGPTRSSGSAARSDPTRARE